MPEIKEKWLSFYVYLPWTGNDFLAESLPSLLTELENENLIKRFFFIRYSEGGYHLRIRFQPQGDEKSEKSIGEKIAKYTQSYRRANGYNNSLVKASKVPYSREQHYFGDTCETVYSELINEQTSRLYLQILSSTKSSPEKLLLSNFSVLVWIFALSAFDEQDYGKSLDESLKFAEENKRNPQNLEIENSRFSENLLNSLNLFLKKTPEFFLNLNSLENAATLIRKLKMRMNGRFAATHSLHLYCNKAGFSMTQEADIYKLIRRIRFEDLMKLKA